MIIKIRTANVETDNSYRFFDGVQGLHYNIIESEVYARRVAENRLLPEGVQCLLFWDEQLPPCNVAELSFHSEMTGPVEITANTTIYLLNDQGKTIERLI